MYLSTYSQSPAQTTKFKPNQKLFDRTYSNLTSIFLLKKVLKYLNNFLNRNFSDLWLKWTQTIEMKQNQTFFHRTYSNLISIFIGSKILKYFNDFYNWHLSMPLQNLPQRSKMKQNQTRHVQIWQHFSQFTKYYGIWITFEIHFLVKFISKMNNNFSRGKMFIIKLVMLFKVLF